MHAFERNLTTNLNIQCGFIFRYQLYKGTSCIMASRVYFIVIQIGQEVGGNFNICICTCSGDFIVRNRRTGNAMLMSFKKKVQYRLHTTQPRDKKLERFITIY